MIGAHAENLHSPDSALNAAPYTLEISTFTSQPTWPINDLLFDQPTPVGLSVSGLLEMRDLGFVVAAAVSVAAALSVMAVIYATHVGNRNQSLELLMKIGRDPRIPTLLKERRRVIHQKPFSKLSEGDFGYDYAPEDGYRFTDALPPSGWALEYYDGENFVGPQDIDPTVSMNGDYWLAASNSEALDCIMETGEDAFDCVSEPTQVRIRAHVFSLVIFGTTVIAKTCGQLTGQPILQGEISYAGVRSSTWCDSPGCDMNAETSADFPSQDYDLFSNYRV